MCRRVMRRAMRTIDVRRGTCHGAWALFAYGKRRAGGKRHRAAAAQLGRRHRGRARAGHRDLAQSAASQCGRQPCRRLFGLSRARHRGQDARLRPSRRSRPIPRRPSRSARTRNGATPRRSSRSIPWGHLVGDAFRDHLARGYDVRPTIAVTRAHIDMPEIRAAIVARRVRADGDIVSAARQCARDEGRDRSGLVSARHRRALRPRPRPICAAACTSRPAACIRSW